MQVRLVPAFDDNYLFVVPFLDGTNCFVVDPGDSVPVLDYLDRAGLNLAAIVITHHHADHIGGVKTLLAKTDCTRVIGPSYDVRRIPFITEPVGDGAVINIGGFVATVLFTPGHTRGHICYYFEDDDVLFCGDTLFSAGCGRMFEGTKEEMSASLQRLASLPEETKIYCAHEYTLANIRFAISVDAHNRDLLAFQRQCEAMRSRGEPTIPSRIGQELKVNPFLRAANADEFGRLRSLKDTFR